MCMLDMLLYYFSIPIMPSNIKIPARNDVVACKGHVQYSIALPYPSDEFCVFPYY